MKGCELLKFILCRDLVGCEPSSCSPSTRPRGRGRRETRGVEKDEKKEMEENEDKKEMEEQEEDKKENTLTGVGTILPFGRKLII